MQRVIRSDAGEDRMSSTERDAFFDRHRPGRITRPVSGILIAHIIHYTRMPAPMPQYFRRPNPLSPQ